MSERPICYNPDDGKIWRSAEEPEFRVRPKEPFQPFRLEDFEGHDITAPDFFIGLDFALDGVGVGSVLYWRAPLLGFNPQWAEEKGATPLGPANLSYRFSLESEVQGVLVPPLQLELMLFAGEDGQPPDCLFDFPSYQCGILSRWSGTGHHPELHPYPQVYHTHYVLPEGQEAKSLYVPDNPKMLSDLKITFLPNEVNSTF